ncbi:uncharacterized protein LOC131434657 [Malaya genurostris]|uniref:uncharacterized protein LOC131434657 n=1 Tax=Malaya genurostris TaxID=325434 RepID=UPI0026F3F96D|nr:uncharacterized protein LOC131434657 [Malaya genurostris]
MTALQVRIIVFTVLLLVSSVQSDSQCVNNPHRSVNLFADPEDCAKYIVCAGQIKIVRTCPAGSWWSESELLCTTSKKAPCGKRPKRRSIELAGISEAQDPAVSCITNSESCPAVFDPNNIILRAHEECGKYYLCISYMPLVLNCPVNLHFNQDTCECDYPGNANCQPITTTTVESTTSVSTTTTTVKPTTTATSTTSTVESTTAVSSTTSTVKPTTTATSTTSTVESTTAVSSTTSTVKPTTTATSTTSTVKPTTTVSWTTTTDASTKPPVSCVKATDPCPAIFDPNDVVLRAHEDCSKYYACISLLPVSFNCPKHLRFNQNTCECDDPESVNCGSTSTTSWEYPSTTTTIHY